MADAAVSKIAVRAGNSLTGAIALTRGPFACMWL